MRLNLSSAAAPQAGDRWNIARYDAVNGQEVELLLDYGTVLAAVLSATGSVPNMLGRTDGTTPLILTSDRAAPGTANQLLVPASTSLFIEGSALVRDNASQARKTFNFGLVAQRTTAGTTAIPWQSVTSPWGTADSFVPNILLDFLADTTNDAVGARLAGVAGRNLSGFLRYRSVILNTALADA